ncbi:MAG: SPOR domain-containing protein [Rickettsiales bacterium]|nr:SPOR domain-containing protein [Rickettsiales bacterium]
MTIIKSFVVFLALLTITACSKGSGKKIRIVDLQGKSHAVKTKVPELNAQILDSQGKLGQQENVFANVSEGAVVTQDIPTAPAEVAAPQNLAANDAQKYPTADYKAAEVELADQKAKLQDDNKMVKVSAGDSVNKEPEVEYDLAKVKKVKRVLKKAETLANVDTAANAENTTLSGFYVQTGAFSTIENATKDEASVKKYAKSQIEESTSGDKKIYRVLLGSFSNKAEALKVIKKLKASGHEAVIVKKK